jgi:prevent-host-death family protein
MEEAVSAAEANRRFSRLLRDVRAGHSFVVTAHGRPVARIVPVAEDEPVRQAAREALFRRLDAQPVQESGAWHRDELYDVGG